MRIRRSAARSAGTARTPLSVTPTSRSAGRLRYYVQLRNGLPKIRIKAEFGTTEFDDECRCRHRSQIALYGDASDHINAQKQRNERARRTSD